MDFAFKRSNVTKIQVDGLGVNSLFDRRESLKTGTGCYLVHLFLQIITYTDLNLEPETLKYSDSQSVAKQSHTYY